MPISLTPVQAAAELRARGHDPHDIVVLSGGLWSAAFAFRENGSDYVVRFHERRDDLEKDHFAQRWVTPRLRTPKIVEIGDMPVGAYGISERVAGTPLDDRDEAGMRTALVSLFDTLDELRQADLSATRGYGLWHGDGTAPHASWRDTLVREDAPGERAEQRRLLQRSNVGVAEFERGLARIHELLPYCTEERFVVHNDVLNYNVFVDARGVVLSNLSGWKQTVSVQYMNPNNLKSASPNGTAQPTTRITVTVTHNNVAVYTMTWLAVASTWP